MLTSLKYIDFARAKSEAPINKFIIYIKQKLVTHKSINFWGTFHMTCEGKAKRC